MDNNWIHYNIDNFDRIAWNDDTLAKFIVNLNSLNIEALDYQTKEKVTSFLKMYNSKNNSQSNTTPPINQTINNTDTNKNIRSIGICFLAFLLVFILVEMLATYIIPTETLNRLIIKIPDIYKKLPITPLLCYFIYYFGIFYLTIRLTIKCVFQKNRTIKTSKLKKFKIMLVLLFPILYFIVLIILKIISNIGTDVFYLITSIITSTIIKFFPLMTSILCNIKRIKTTID